MLLCEKLAKVFFYYTGENNIKSAGDIMNKNLYHFKTTMMKKVKEDGAFSDDYYCFAVRGGTKFSKWDHLKNGLFLPWLVYLNQYYPLKELFLRNEKIYLTEHKPCPVFWQGE